jgi:hypothetical protein
VRFAGAAAAANLALIVVSIAADRQLEPVVRRRTGAAAAQLS